MKEEKSTKIYIPILINVFNRIEPIEKLFQILTQIKQKKLYIASNGYRTSVDGEM
jgi:uncharacterized protein YndB with AHSA1/START domain